MMQEIGQYVVSITLAALVSGLILSLFQEGTCKSLLKLICGVFLCVTALMPLTSISLPDVSAFSDFYYLEGVTVSEEGEQMARAAILLRMKEQLEAYICDKAMESGLHLAVDVQLDDQGTPTSVGLDGSCTEAQKQILGSWIEQELRITKEHQTWTG